MVSDNGNKNNKAMMGKFVFVLLFILGIFGSGMSLLLHRDTTAAIMMGYGFSLLELHNRMVEGDINFRPVWLIVFVAAADLISISSIIYSTIKFPTVFNKVICGGFIALQSWNTYLIIYDLKKK